MPDQISCHLKTFEPGRALDDYGTAVIRYQNGALGTVTASQISHGRENDLWIEIDGTKGSLEWHQEEPNKMLAPRQRPAAPALHARSERPVHDRARQGLVPAAERPSRRRSSRRSPTSTPRLTTTWSPAPAARRSTARKSLYPNVGDGVDGMNFITQSVASSKENGAWLSLKHPLCR